MGIPGTVSGLSGEYPTNNSLIAVLKEDPDLFITHLISILLSDNLESKNIKISGLVVSSSQLLWRISASSIYSFLKNISKLNFIVLLIMAIHICSRFIKKGGCDSLISLFIN